MTDEVVRREESGCTLANELALNDVEGECAQASVKGD